MLNITSKTRYAKKLNELSNRKTDFLYEIFCTSMVLLPIYTVTSLENNHTH